MFFDSLEEKSRRNKQKLKELMIRNEKMDQDLDKLFNDYDINPDEVIDYLQKKENFTDKQWDEIGEAQQILDERLKVELKNVKDPRKTQQAQNDRLVRPHWLYVR